MSEWEWESERASFQLKLTRHNRQVDGSRKLGPTLLQFLHGLEMPHCHTLHVLQLTLKSTIFANTQNVCVYVCVCALIMYVCVHYVYAYVYLSASTVDIPILLFVSSKGIVLPRLL